MVKNPFASVGDARDMGLSTEIGRFPEAGNGNLLQYSCLENSMDREPGRLQSTCCKESDTTEQLNTLPE